MNELKISNSSELREYLFKLMDKWRKDGIKQIIAEYETQSLLLESKLRKDMREKLKESERSER